MLRTDRVDDEIAGQIPRGGRDGVSGRQAVDKFLAAYAPTLLQQRRSGRSMDCAVDAAAAEQFRIGRVDDRVDLLLGDVPEHGLDAHRHQRRVVMSMILMRTSNR